MEYANATALHFGTGGNYDTPGAITYGLAETNYVIRPKWVETVKSEQSLYLVAFI